MIKRYVKIPISSHYCVKKKCNFPFGKKKKKKKNPIPIVDGKLPVPVHRYQ